MIQFFRSGLTSYFATALLGLLIASFALWGIGGDMLGGAGNSVAQIGNDKLPMNVYTREFQNKYSEIQQQSDGEVTREMVIDEGLANQWVSELVQREAFAYKAHALNIRVTDKQLRDYITGIEAFQNTLGEFSKSNFENIARSRGNTSGEFEEILRSELERLHLIRSIASSISVPGAIERILVKYLMEERTADIVTIPAYSIQNIPEPDEEALLEYYESNSAHFMAPEYRDFRFITLSVKDYADGITITAEEIEQAMGVASAVSGGNETRDFDQILFDDKDSADRAFSNLETGISFADIIMASGSTAEDAAVPENTQQDVVDSYGLSAAEAVFATGKDGYTAPVETDFGWRIFYVTKISAATGDAESLRAEAEKTLRTDKAIDVLYEKSERINDELAAGASLSDIAATLSLDLKTALEVDLSGYNSKGDLVAGIPADPAFLANAFDALEDDEPLLEEMDNGDYFLTIIDNVQPRALRPFEDVRPSVLDLWQADARKNMARKQANEIIIKAQDDVSMEDIAATSDDTTYNSVTLTRNDQTGKVAQAIHHSIFSLDIGSAEIVPAADGDGFVVVKALSRKLSDDSMPLAQSIQLRNLLTQEYQQRFLASYWRYLETSLPVKINQRAVNAVHDQLASREQ